MSDQVIPKNESSAAQTGETLAQVLEALPELDAQLSAAMAKMTPTQRRRLTASLGGESTSAIARREGVTPQSIHETLQAYRVRGVLRVVGEMLATSQVHKANGSSETVIEAMISNLVMIAGNATRTVVAGGSVVKVPDYRLRMEATIKLLDLAVDAWKPAAPEASDRDHSEAQTEELIARETTTVKREVRQRRNAREPGGAP